MAARNFNNVKPANKVNMTAPLLEPGSYPARVVGIAFLGVQKQRPYQGQAKPPHEEVRYFYELSTEFMLDEKGNPIENKPRWFSEDLLVYGAEADKAKLTLRNKAIDPADKSGGDPSALVGLPCNVLLVHYVGKDGEPKEKVGGVSPAVKLKGYTQPELVNPSFYLDPWDADNCSLEVFRKLPEFLRTKIMKADNFASSYLSKLLGGETNESVSTEQSSDTSSYDAGTSDVDNAGSQDDNPW